MKLASGAADVSGLLVQGRHTWASARTVRPATTIWTCSRRCARLRLMAKLVSGNPEALDARTVIHMATLGGAKALGMDDSIGSLKPGKLADVTVVDLDRIHLTPAYDPLSHLVYAARGSDVRHVLVNGKLVVRNGHVVTIDEGELKAQVRSKARKIGSSLGRQLMGDYARHV